MSKEEIMITTLGELSDMVACRAIANGWVKEAKRLTLDEMLSLR